MKKKERSEQSKNEILQVCLRLFGSKGYEGTSVVDIEEELHQTRGALIYHFKSKLKLFEAVVNRYYFGRVMPSSLPEDWRDTFSLLKTKLVMSMEEECLRLKYIGINNVSGVYINLENDALRLLPDFREKCVEQYRLEMKVVEQAVRKSMDDGVIKKDVMPSVVAEMFMNVIRGQAYIGNIMGLDYYTDGMARQLNGLNRLISISPYIE